MTVALSTAIQSMHLAVFCASRFQIAWIGIHWKHAMPISGPVNKSVKTEKAITARFNHGFGKIRRYKQRMLNLSKRSSIPQNIVVMYALNRQKSFQFWCVYILHRPISLTCRKVRSHTWCPIPASASSRSIRLLLALLRKSNITEK